MLQLQLYIEGQEVEMFKDESVTLTQSIQDIRDISKVFTDFTRTFNVPASKINNKLFKHFYNFHIVGFDARKKRDATILLNYKPFKQGKIKLEGVRLKNNESESYKLTFYGNTVSLKDILGEDKLSKLVNLEYFNFQYNDTNIKTYMSDGKDVNFFNDTINEAIIFPLITVDNRIIWDNTSVNTDTIKNVNPSVSVGTVGLPISQLKPAIKLFPIISAIEQQYPELEFSRDFFNNEIGVFGDLYMWLHNKEGVLFSDQDAQYPVSNFTITDGSSQDIQGFKGGSFENSFSESDSERDMNVKVVPSGTAAYNLVIKKDGEAFEKYDNLTGETEQTKIVIPNGTYTFFIETDVVSSYTVYVLIRNKPKNIFSGNKKITYSGSAEYITDKVLNIPSLMPNMRIIDFLTGLFKMFNLTAFRNDNGIIEVKTLDNYFASSTKVWDITKHLDKTQSTVNAILPFKEIMFSYEGLDTFLTDNHKNLFNKGWGNLNYRDGDKFDGTNYEVVAPFEHLKYERVYVTDNGVIQTTTNSDGNEEKTNSLVQYGYAVDDSENSYLGKPILFYAAKTTGNIRVRDLDDSTDLVSNTYLPFNHLGGTIFNNLQNLHFGVEISEWHREPNKETLFKNYYKKFVKDMMDSRKRISTFKAFLPIEVLHNLNLADRIIVFDDMYRINKITTDFSTNQSTLELHNIFEEIKYNTILNVAIQNVLADTTLKTADEGNLTADGDSATDGFDVPNITTEVPSEIPANEPTPAYEDEVVLVEPPEIQLRLSNIDTEDTVYLRYAVTKLGKLMNTEMVQEFGFFISGTKSDLSPTTYDELYAASAVTNISLSGVPTQLINVPYIKPNRYTLPSDPVTVPITGLTHPTTIYYRFYARTYTGDLYDNGNVVGPIIESKTIGAALPQGINFTSSVYVVNDSPSYPPDVSCGTKISSDIDKVWFFEHTGGARDVQVGDFVRVTGLEYKGETTTYNTTYGNNLLTFAGFQTQIPKSDYDFVNFYDWKILDSTRSQYMAIRVNKLNGEVVRVTTCP